MRLISCKFKEIVVSLQRESENGETHRKLYK